MTNSTKDARRRMHAARGRAEQIVRDVTAAEAILNQAWAKAERYSGHLDRLRRDLFALMRFSRASLTRQYPKVPWSSLVTAMAAIIYFWNPMDAIPDFLVGTGLLDDATVIALALRSLRGDLAAFQAWEKEENSVLDATNAPQASDD